MNAYDQLKTELRERILAQLTDQRKEELRIKILDYARKLLESEGSSATHLPVLAVAVDSLLTREIVGAVRELRSLNMPPDARRTLGERIPIITRSIFALALFILNETRDLDLSDLV